jgi:hypothetical protein
MTRIAFVLAIGLMVIQCGCMTTLTLDAAKGPHVKNAKGETVHEPRPAYYLLLPATVPADVATFPCQCFCSWLIRASCSCM